MKAQMVDLSENTAVKVAALILAAGAYVLAVGIAWHNGHHGWAFVLLFFAAMGLWDFVKK